MRNFDHYRAASFEEAAEGLESLEEPAILAGGTDIISGIRDEIFDSSPKSLIDIKGIQGADVIESKDGTLEVGALAKLSTIAENEAVKSQATALAEAAYSVATPLVRNLGTIGGNICQDVRCWYYRYPHEAGDRLVCRRKGGDVCHAIQGRNRYHSVFGGAKCGSASCTSACPASTDIPAYMAQIRAGNIEGAAQILMQVNPMPAITGRVCAHLCQDECNHHEYGDSVSVRNVERFLGDYILKNKDVFYGAPEHSTGKKMAIIGSGPAGLSAAFYLRKAGNEVTVFDAKDEPGGMLMYAIPAYRLPKSIVRDLIDAYKSMGIVFECGKRIGTDIEPAQIEAEFDSVCYATGAWKRPVLGLNGEDLTVFGLDFLVQVSEWMKGKIGQEVLVTGGGNVAMDVAVTAKRLGAKKVVMACLESEEEMPASKGEIDRAREEGIEIMPSWGLSKVVSENGVVKGMELVRCISVRDEEGNFNPQYDENEKTVVAAENILMAVGQQVDLSFLDEKYQLQLSNRGLIDVESETQATSRPGVFAAGDATTGPKTIIQAVANGHVAANGMVLFCGERIARLPKPEEPEFLSYDYEGIQVGEGLVLDEIALEDRAIDVEDELSPSLEGVVAEAKRCMNCGCYSVAPSDITPALIVLDASIETTKRVVSAEEFACTDMRVEKVLEPGEIVTKIVIPTQEGVVSHYDKFRIRKTLDWAIVSLASPIKMDGDVIESAKLVLGGCAPVPLRLSKVEDFLVGKQLTGALANEAGELAVEDCVPMWENTYKVQEIRVMVRDALRRLI